MNKGRPLSHPHTTHVPVPRLETFSVASGPKSIPLLPPAFLCTQGLPCPPSWHAAQPQVPSPGVPLILPQQPACHGEEARGSKAGAQAAGQTPLPQSRCRQQETGQEGQRTVPGSGWGRCMRLREQPRSKGQGTRLQLTCPRAGLSCLSRPKHYPSANAPQAHCPAWLG